MITDVLNHVQPDTMLWMNHSMNVWLVMTLVLNVPEVKMITVLVVIVMVTYIMDHVLLNVHTELILVRLNVLTNVTPVMLPVHHVSDQTFMIVSIVQKVPIITGVLVLKSVHLVTIQIKLFKLV
jgi:hypothetical protein